VNTDDLCGALRNSLPTLYECMQEPQEGVRVRTPLLYPDGGIVDVFVLERGERHLVTDYGDALGWLRMQSASGKLSPKQRWLVDDVRLTLGVDLQRGQLQLPCDDPGGIADAVQRVAQAVVRVSDVWFTFRTRAAESIADEVDDWLKERSFGFEKGVKRDGRSGRSWTVDYRIVAGARTSLVFLLSSGSRAAARRVSEHVVAGCVDLSHLPQTGQESLVSLFDDTADVWRPEDLNIVEGVSRLVTWSRPDKLASVLMGDAPPSVAPPGRARRSRYRMLPEGARLASSRVPPGSTSATDI